MAPLNSARAVVAPAVVASTVVAYPLELSVEPTLAVEASTAMASGAVAPHQEAPVTLPVAPGHDAPVRVGARVAASAGVAVAPFSSSGCASGTGADMQTRMGERGECSQLREPTAPSFSLPEPPRSPPSSPSLIMPHVIPKQAADRSWLLVRARRGSEAQAFLVEQARGLEDAVLGLLQLPLTPLRRQRPGAPLPKRPQMSTPRWRLHGKSVGRAAKPVRRRKYYQVLRALARRRRSRLAFHPRQLALSLQPMVLIFLSPTEMYVTLSADACMMRVMYGHPAMAVAPLAVPGHLYMQLMRDMDDHVAGQPPATVLLASLVRLRAHPAEAHRPYEGRSRHRRGVSVARCLCWRPNALTMEMAPPPAICRARDRVRRGLS